MDLFQSWGPFNRSEYYNFTGPPIDCGGSKRFRVFIDDNDLNYNWNKTVSENEWCNGSGTYEDPYVIENLYINAHEVGGCIYIRNSKKFFTIKNCWFENSGWVEYGCGVFLRWLGNGTVQDNIILYTRTGIKTELLVYNVTISNNIMISDHTGKVGGKGIHVGSESNNMTVFGNKILNHYQGMMVEFSDNIIVDKNILENRIWKDYTGGHPVSLYDTNYSKLKRNVLAGAFAQGTFKVDQEGCEGNVVENNIVTTNQSIAFDFDSILDSINNGGGDLNLAANPPGLIGLSGSYYNYVGYNISLVDSLPSSASGLPLNMIILIIGILSIAVAIVAIAVVVRGRKRE